MKSVLTFGQHYRDAKRTREQEFEQMKKSGDFELWPFKTKVEYQKQLENQPFLSGIEK
jgi:phenylacetate-coenzyme A ligase PaaK-like adenylate-forming protein